MDLVYQNRSVGGYGDGTTKEMGMFNGSTKAPGVFEGAVERVGEEEVVRTVLAKEAACCERNVRRRSVSPPSAISLSHLNVPLPFTTYAPRHATVFAK